MSPTRLSEFVKEAGAEPLPGYRLVEPLGRGGFGEVWKCAVPGGLFKAIKFVPDADAAGGRRSALDQELQAFQNIKEVRHPFILSIERVELVAGELLMVMELADKNLEDRFREFRAAGLPGVPRGELLALLLEAAEALDWMNFQHGLLHLDVKPTNLFVVSNHVKVGDFGLVNRVESRPPGEEGVTGAGVTPLYVAPEILRRQVHRHSDQYNLALAFQDLLTGVHPVSGDNPRQVLMNHLSHEPNLDPLPESDRSVVARALAKDPDDRFPSCTDFMLALASGSEVVPPWRTAAALATRARADDETRPHPTPTKLLKRPTVAPEETASDEDVEPLPPPPARQGLSLPGYQILDCVGRSSLGDLWTVRAEDGRERLARFLPPDLGGDPSEQPRRLAWLNTLRHPALQSQEVLAGPGGQLVIVTDPSNQSVHHRFQECREEGLPGIARNEMLDYLSLAAEALDILYDKHGLQHQGLTPRSLLVQGDRLRIADYGLVELARQAGRPSVGDPYQALEAAAGEPGPACDQYSLALIYVEMVTGVHPRPGRGRSRMGPARPVVAKWNLDFLPFPDRAAIARALDADPDQRFASCTELVRALEAATPGDAARPKRADFPSLVTFADLARGLVVPAAAPPPRQFLDEVLAVLTRARFKTTPDRVSYLERPGGVLECNFLMRWLPGVARLKLDALRERWGGHFIRQEERILLVRLYTAPSLWERWRGREAGLEIEVEAFPCPGTDVHLAEVVARVRTFGHGKGPELPQMLAQGPALLHSIREQLQNVDERRQETRLPCDRPVHVYAAPSDREFPPPLEGRCKNISLTGLALWLTARPISRRLYLHFPDAPPLAGHALLARLIRREEKDGGYDAAVAFVLPK
jgi:serine/threonine protein kinase